MYCIPKNVVLKNQSDGSIQAHNRFTNFTYVLKSYYMFRRSDAILRQSKIQRTTNKHVCVYKLMYSS